MDNLKNIIDELDAIVPAKNKHVIIESKAVHLIASAAHLVKLIKESYPNEEANDLVKRLFRSMIHEDSKKFTRKIKELRKAK